MISSRKNNKNNSEKLNLERKVDQFIEVSRQFVDGVSGTRPGKRKSSSFKELSRTKVNNVTKWVGQKMDSFFEDEDDLDEWDDHLENESEDFMRNYSRNEQSSQKLISLRKRPLTAISLRTLEIKPKQLESSNEEWPDDSDFQIDRWKRASLRSGLSNPYSNNHDEIRKKGRNLPKSSRRRI